MTDTPPEWIAMAWAARDAACASLNAERRNRFEAVKSLILERDLPTSKVTRSDIPNISKIRRATA